MGRPPGDGFSPSRSWLVSGLYVGRAGALRLPTTTLPRVTGLTLDVSPDPPLRGHMTHLERSQQFYRVPAHLFGETEDLPALRGPHDFPQATLPSSTFSPAQTVC